MKQLSGMDRMFLDMEGPNTPMVLSTFDIYDVSTAPLPVSGFEEVLGIWQTRLAKLDMLGKRLHRVSLNLDDPYWIDEPDFEMEDHFFRMTLPRPGNWKQLMRLCGNLMSRPMDMNRPLWEVHVIEGINAVQGLATGSFAVLCRMHHAFADGATTVAMRESTHTLSPEPAPRATLRRARSAKRSDTEVPDRWTMLRTAAGNAFDGVGRASRGLGEIAPALARNTVKSLRRSLSRGGELVPKTAPVKVGASAFNRPFGTRRIVDMCRMDFSDGRAMRDLAPGCTINDLGLAIMGGAIRRYLLDYETLPEESMSSIVPMNIRKKGDTTPGNVVSNLIVPLGTDLPDPIERLRAIQAATAFFKDPDRLEINRGMMHIGSGLPAVLIAPMVRSVFGGMELTGYAPASTAISNVPAFLEPRYLAGARMVQIGGFGMLMPNTGVTHGITIYNNEFQVSLITCPEVMSDTAAYIGCIRESFEEFRALALGGQPRRKVRERTRTQTRRSVKKAAARRSPAN